MRRKYSSSRLGLPVFIGAAAAAIGYFLFKDDIAKNTKKYSPFNYKKGSKMPRYPKIRKKGRPQGSTGQTDRIKRIISVLAEKKQFTLSEIRYRFPLVTERTLRRDLDKLERDGKLVKKGNTRSTVYFKK